MASLRSMILDGRTAPVPLREDGKKYAARFELTQKALRSRDTILVNTNSVERDLFNADGTTDDRSYLDRRLIPRPKPPYPVMWLESVKANEWMGSLVTRMDIVNEDHLKAFVKASPISYDRDQLEAIGKLARPTIVEVVSWAAGKGYVEPVGDFVYWLNAEGDWQDSRYWHFGPLSDSFHGIADIQKDEFKWIRTNYQLIAACEYSVLHTFARMNCHNVKLVPITAGAPKPKKSSHPPFSSPWHEIVVTSLPQLRREQKGEVAPDGEKRELRFHRVRGHYADYTKGKGLFGNPNLRKQFWIEEHKSGDPEQGTVVSSYTV